MDVLVRERRPLRILFKKWESEIQELFDGGVVDSERILVKFDLLDGTFERLSSVDRRILDEILINPVSEQAEDEEHAGQAEFKERLEIIRRRVNSLTTPSSLLNTTVGEGGSTTGTDGKVRNFKLPRVELPKFSGELKDWLGWWAQFEKIDGDEHMSGSDKFIYLLQCLKPSSDAYKIVSRFPQSNQNYSEAVAALKKKYADPDLLLEVYIGELLGMIVANFTRKDKISMKDLYLAPDSQLRSLRTLNLEKADPSTWLYPLVEACLPKEILSEWRRNRSKIQEDNPDGRRSNRLDSLLKFMEGEVEIQDRVELTRSFAEKATTVRAEESKKRNTTVTPRNQIPTMAGFYKGDTTRKRCVFCNQDGHDSCNCHQAKVMTLYEKKAILRKHFRCFNCFRRHLSMNCKAEDVKCQLCNGRHYTVMCEQNQQQSGNRYVVNRKRHQSDKRGGHKRAKIETQWGITGWIYRCLVVVWK